MRAAANAAWNTIMLLLSKLLSRRHGGCLWGLTTKTRSRSSSCSSSLPSSLTGPPVSALVPPGVCQFGNDWIAVPLLQRFPVSHSSSVLRFALPDRTRPLQLSTCACLLANVWVTSDVGGGGGDCDATTTVPDSITRPYTPVSTNANIGHFDLLVKRYGPQARMSRHLHDTLNVGETVRFRHTDGNVKIQAPFDYDHIGMLVGGTGIAPMIQALHAILGPQDDNNKRNTKVTMLYGSKCADDILGYELLHQWTERYPDRLQVIHVLSDEPIQGSAWKGARGYIHQAMIETYFPKPSCNSTSAEFIILVCGPPPMYNALCGAREEKDVKGLLGAMGYRPDQVYKF